MANGGAGNDTLNGTSANDNIYGGGGDDVIYGGDGNDNVRGDAGNDTLYGGAGNDQLDGGIGADTLYGGDGNDVYVVDNLGDLVIEGLNGGTDTVRSYLDYTLGANLENLELLGNAAITATGNALANVIKGNEINNGIYGGAGIDSLNGMGGNDVLVGGDGGDFLAGGGGADRFVFNRGETNDGVWMDRVSDLNFAEGDTLVLAGYGANGGDLTINSYTALATYLTSVGATVGERPGNPGVLLVSFDTQWIAITDKSGAGTAQAQYTAAAAALNHPITAGETRFQAQQGDPIVLNLADLNVHDVDGDAITLLSVTAGSHLTATLSNNTITAQWAAGYSYGDTSLTYTARSADGSTVTGTVAINVARTGLGTSNQVDFGPSTQYFDTEYPGGEAVASLTNGQMVAVYIDGTTTNARILNADGSATATEFSVGTGYASVTALAANRFAVATAGNLKIYQANASGAPTLVQTVASGLTEAPSIAAGADGTIFLKDVNSGAIRSFATNGTSYASSTSYTSNGSYGEIKVLANGDLASMNGTAGTITLFHKGQATAFKSVALAGSTGYNDIAALDIGGFVVSTGNGGKLLATVYDAAGTVVRSIATTLPTNSNNFTHVSAVAGGGFVAAATDANSVVHYQEFLADGTAVTTVQTVSTNAAASFFINTNTTADGGFVLMTNPNQDGVASVVSYDGGRTYTGGAGNDLLTGGAFGDKLDGAGGHNVLTGKGGADTFVFGAAANTTTIADYTAGTDKVQIDHNVLANWASLQSHAQQVGTAVVITADADHVLTLANTTLATLQSHAADFVFV